MFKKRLASLGVIGVLAAAFALPATTAGADGGVSGGCGYAAGDYSRNVVDTSPGRISAYYDGNAQGRFDTQRVRVFWGITSSHKDQSDVKTMITYGPDRSENVDVAGKLGVIGFGGANGGRGYGAASPAGLYNFTVIVGGQPIGTFSCAVLDNIGDSQ